MPERMKCDFRWQADTGLEQRERSSQYYAPDTLFLAGDEVWAVCGILKSQNTGFNQL
ncbi:hypothetical protein FBY58_1862 [Zymomonas mobilis]|uniref:Uncharacterized protein n=1 Tax=Zymomonas mobilis TaxID=542 RepID=A0A542VUD5_ZYMMB|nr:hypothetical protein FBY58_1862 [Zymomonas mobilis]